MLGQPFFLYGLNFAFFQRPRAINRRLIMKQYAHAHLYFLDIVVVNASESPHNNLEAKGSQVICSFLKLWEWRPGIRPKFELLFFK